MTMTTANLTTTTKSKAQTSVIGQMVQKDKIRQKTQTGAVDPTVRIMTGKTAIGNQMRHEIKHRITMAEDSVLCQRLRRLFKRDEYAGADGSYTVTSLYFDDPYDSALREKLDGVDGREKFRIRYYGRDTSFIRLEKKYKKGGLCGKRSARLTQEQAEKVLSGDIEFLVNSSDPLLIEFYSKLKGRLIRPKTVVCYDREAFIYEPGNVRVTLDRNIRTGLYKVDFLNPGLLLVSAREQTILEVKYDAFLPDIVRAAVQPAGKQAQSCSKYAVCRRFD